MDEVVRKLAFGRMRRHIAVAACAVAVVGDGGAAAQQQGVPADTLPTFRVETRLLEVDVTVTDRDGRTVPGLSRDDFEVFQDGRAREIAAVSAISLSRRTTDERRVPAALADVSIDIATNAVAGGRTFVMIIGTIAYRELPRFQSIARRFVERYLEPGDRLSIVHVGHPGLNQTFTSSVPLLLASIARACGQRFPQDWVQRYEPCPRRGSDLAVLRQVLADLRPLGGPRKHVLFISPAGVSEREVPEIARLANASHASIYWLDPGGLPPVRSDFVGLSSSALAQPRRVPRDAQPAVRRLSAETGGLAITNSNNWPAAFERAIQNASAYYVLAYYAAARDEAASSGSLEVRVRKAGLTVRMRADETVPAGGRGGAAPPQSVAVPEGMSPQIVGALRNPFSLAGLPMEVFASPFKGPDAGGSLLLGVALDGAALRVNPDMRLEIAHGRVGATGDVQGTSRRLVLTPSAEVGAALVESGVRSFERLELEPGRHEIRVAAVHAGVRGSVVLHVDVPDFTSEPITMSGLVISSAAGDGTVLRTDPAIARMLASPPTLRRHFDAGDELLVFAEVYVNDSRLREGAAATLVVTASDGRDVLWQDAPLVRLADTDASRVALVAHVPLDTLRPDTYTMTVEARSPSAPSSSATRQLSFAIVPPARSAGD